MFCRTGKQIGQAAKKLTMHNLTQLACICQLVTIPVVSTTEPSHFLINCCAKPSGLDCVTFYMEQDKFFW